ncbi:MAG TPA: hypothetical protein DCY48_01975 [Candidatus Magasanikbacteria bacterium]|nr:MAG: hypothetical protein A3I74_00885 [Candidatus Magasanikbacteria bacterium RIFCSPLOWO2_02_FULL_47_16]OGH79999.1 MAG: hypothetical protein A3C10_02340 [Candidatus Magasanikbacteria bacterium RIFCSPHIGHO2_02_FULL_48_18]OGH83472.1 MAG: hypothetical protein A3G08_04065 [Candidatus Magasanikbacteria bacterium RIFCSPLOWO2_12_FULL_47_9b]HAZ28524.1 hypothetical protein [Candidatus Magasanikbacteria bacterium]
MPEKETGIFLNQKFVFRKKIFNHHKIKRRWNHQKRTFRHLFDMALPRQRARLGTHQSYNPYRKETKKGISKTTRLLCICFCISVTVIALWLFHPVFQIRTIDVDGLQRIEEQEFLDVITGVLHTKKGFFFSGSAYILVDPSDIESILRERFPISEVVVAKEFPNTLSLAIKEKISTLIYDNGQEYAYVGLDGKIVERLRMVGEDEWREKTQMVTSTDAEGNIQEEKIVIERTHIPPADNLHQDFGDYPIIYDMRQKEIPIPEHVLKQEWVERSIAWFRLLQEYTDIRLEYVALKDEMGSAEIQTDHGWKIFVDLTRSADDQFRDFQIVLKEKIQEQSFQYIDVRYEGRVYWQ